MIFNREVLVEKLDGDDVVIDEITDAGRWTIGHEIVFRHDEKLYRSWYSVGATEYQDDPPWDGEEEVECPEVEPYEAVVTKYREVGR